VATRANVTLGLGANWRQFALLVLVNAFVGAMVGVERSVLPTLAESEFGVTSSRATLTFLIAFGLTKAASNFVAGDLADRLGRKRILVAGWLAGLPVPLLLIYATDWTWIGVANLFLGVNQGLAWSATVIMKIDLVGPRRRGLAMGLNEFAGYVAVAAAALGAGYLAAAHGPRPAPFLIAAVAAVAGLVLSAAFVEDTGDHVALERSMADAALEGGPGAFPPETLRRFKMASWGHPALLGANQAGLVNNLNDGVAWGLIPVFLAHAGLGGTEIGWIAAVYPAVWGLGQLGTGALSDQWGRRPLIVFGMLVQGLGLLGFALAGGLGGWIASAVALGIGTAAVYPTLIAQVSDVVSPTDRATAVGVYRLWRDLGYVVGAVVAGTLADAVGYEVAIASVAVLTAVSGVAARLLLPSASATDATSDG
jgi:MFS family permease